MFFTQIWQIVQIFEIILCSYALTENINSAITEFTIKMQCDYTYIIPRTTFPIDVSVLLVTPTTLTVADHGKDIADMIAEGINSWMKTNNPQTNARTFAFMLTAYSITDSYLPILQTPFTVVLLEDITI
ncbi:hypothetical protein [Flavobacterium tructae]|uniref:Uncharacterized protein n=1 Tax=Flavobacterium tructae TaxID=1114873 RepID=A0A1S1JC41_9FLAO|nr:hypothetical protein [Flavobacterium tructae]OHT47025.1 hypothetical protein BHE19_22065 [Flavobacterium tructae]OXB14490.1 hypothetical protein B0A71_21560 [Flavobacterium tructae]